MTDTVQPTPYRVLARKYRPTDFATLIGQDAMVRTLTNAIASGRLAHAFVLTGVRGVGKTTTARIIARALNCIGPDGQGGPTIDPCGQCEHCRAIAEDRHVDILEMDAASRTGVNDIREIIESVRYRPTSARFKVYIIDEVHMLSTAAFNALLKTLEEPPEHVKFIFATTEIRKIPVTVLSRCQRFDLRRVEMEVLAKHFSGIADKEGAEIEPGALRLIARAADGSVRDGLSLLDQAISHGAGLVSEAQVRDMLGLADRARVFDLFELVMKGQMAPALDLLAEQYALGADPAVVVQDMLELAHWLTRLKITPDAADSSAASETEKVKGTQMAGDLSMAQLTRTWQMLLKGLAEVRAAPNPLQAAEMSLVRLAYVADLPSPADLIQQLRDNPPSPRGPGGGGAPAPGGGGTVALSTRMVSPGSMGGPSAALKMEPALAAQPIHLPAMPASFAEVVALFSEKREGVLAVHLRNQVNPVKFEAGRIEFRPHKSAPQDLAPRVSRLLSEWTGRRWTVTVNLTDPADPTLSEQEALAEHKRREDAANHPLVRAVLDAFPGAAIEIVRDLVEAEPEESDLAFDADLTPGEEEL
ncbi:DNA polymerase III subunit gamma/tau [Magnetospirillum gryphiswaldense]|uniref:DNA polymerase III subunit gamma/tau n=1 Tax=Magnetospirillum gryphiswaldense TaxID=55518 RepID=A4TY23_9PROT|nr:DNA polymerase III subunit gamma/tau [Magnetospirillum gryphiswaldense]AVM76130.1 DNA polymerase III subunit tau [Magnetospirillum gryphiswaldense MSR-1]AVM80033.1 DNA polymerase III subunit tau [Magnetospirillum gryphiswaldense]CAM75530.1 DNA-directed DNA polymerase [Magnetospirillum gryphiswaldense MSR-1]